MKKILFISIVCTAVGLLTSCSAEDIEEQGMSVAADDTGGQYGVPKPPPPPPPDPGINP